MAEKKLLAVGDVEPPKQLLVDEHFYIRDNTRYCVRPSCEDCQYKSTCTREEILIKIGPGINIREAFRVRPGFKWACFDFAGIELVVRKTSGKELFGFYKDAANRPDLKHYYDQFPFKPFLDRDDDFSEERVGDVGDD